MCYTVPMGKKKKTAEHAGEDKKKKKRKKKKYRVFWAFVRLQIFLMLLVCGGLAYYYLGGYAAQVSELREEAHAFVKGSDQSTFRSEQTGIVYDVNGNQISTLKGAKDVYYLTYDEIPEQAKEAIVSIEDKKFFRHSGIDLKGIVRAGWAMVRDGEVSQGGSTITQQLARTVFLNNDRTWQRKMEEIFIATELEEKYSKEQLLEFYLNNIYFGNGYYGIQAASLGYFQADVSTLSLSQIAYLCAIPNNPTLYDPYRHHDNTLGRRDRILDQMVEDGKITAGTAQAAKEELIALAAPTQREKYDYVETYTYYCATRALMEQQGFVFRYEFATESEQAEYEEEYSRLYKECERSLYTQGYRIYTSIDLNIQQSLQQAVDDNLAEFTEVNDEGIYALQSAAVCMDNESGFVKAVVGGRSQEYDGHMFNRAYQSYRQPGSAIKPLIVYTPLLERGYTADTVLVDEPIEDGPENYDGIFRGEVTLRYAVEHSINTVAWKCLEELTPEVGLSYLEQMNFARLDEEDYRPAAALGGFTTGVSPVEMAAAYMALEHDGFYRAPTCVVRIEDADGNELYRSVQAETQVYKTNAARQMTDILTGVLTTGTADWISLSGTESAGKTGTTNSHKDGWFVGYTRYYTTSVWVGYDIPRELPELTGSSYPAAIWHDFMEGLHEGLPYASFVAPLGSQTEETEEAPEDVEAAPDDTSEEPEDVPDGTSEDASADTSGEPEDGADDTSEEGEADSGDGA